MAQLKILFSVLRVRWVGALTVPSSRHDCGKQRILKVLNLEDTPPKQFCAFAIERSRGAHWRNRLPLSQSIFCMTTNAVESVHLDPSHNAHCDGNPGCSRMVSFSIRIQDGGVHHCVGGGNHACGPQPLQRQARVDTSLPGSSRGICTIPSDAVFPLNQLHTRHGDSGAAGRFADNRWKIHRSVCA